MYTRLVSSTIALICLSMSVAAKADRAIVLALPQPASCHLGQKVLLTSVYQYSIENDSDENHIYELVESLIVDGTIKKIDKLISVELHSIISVTDVLDFSFFPTIAGTFNIRSKIKVIGNVTVTDFEQASLVVN